ncbi:hypothetical protein SAMN05880582_101242 [Rhizobium sp. RU20A]|uniref:hypothetical protein n=1 Tax=Rhizobium sp. RU20A TaxID=1907412 RepID=UPI0009565021|nr:hypothetical protein [Rhizobium sp. RU20A]SIP97737.1 hypothetical protein SAMN05880582_101242 [Rhizobium sp. RU20A]
MRSGILAAVALAIPILLPALPAAAQLLDPDRIVAAATGDFDKDGTNDLVLLVAPAQDKADEDHGVYLFLTGETGKLTLKEIVPNLVWGAYDLFGQNASLEAMANGSFVIVSHNDAIGRDRWEQRLTIAYRNNEFAVAGYTYTGYDTLNPDAAQSCDINMLTGKGKANDKPVAITGKLIYLRDWKDEMGRKPCGLE